ncbi:MAG: AAA family ATPase [Pirellulales bacterium]
MSLAMQLAEYVRAAFSGIYIPTLEPDDALAEIQALCREQQWRLAHWDLNRGLTIPGVEDQSSASSHDPLATVRALATLDSSGQPTLMVLRGFHRFLGNAEIVQALERQLHQGKVQQTFLVILAPVVQLPPELERMFVILEHELPDRRQLLQIAQGVATEAGELPAEAKLDSILDAAVGLTRFEAEGAFALALVRHGVLQPETIWDLKAQTLTKNGLLSLHRGGESFESLGGLSAMKAFCQRSLLQPARGNPAKRPRGVLLLGVPGTGKSAFAKALGSETGRPTLILDIGALLGSLVGQTEQNIRQALKIADAMAPCILFCDEIDKALAGVSSGQAGDSGVSARLFGTLLTWMNDHSSDVYVVATCNDISRLPPEMSRAERFDGIFFLDLPGSRERQAIWRMYLRQFELDAAQPLPPDEGWTGAEVRACCRLAALLDLPLVEAARNIVPIAVTAAESVERLRTWASGRCLSADQAGIFLGAKSQGNSSRRRVQRDPSSN